MQRMCLVMAAAMGAWGQTESWDAYTFTAPAGWQKNSPGGRLEFLLVQGRQFCQIGLTQSGGGTGEARGDFEREWQSLVVKPYGAGKMQGLEAPAVNGWQARFGAAPVNLPPTGQFTSSLMTFTNGNRIASVLMNGNHDGCTGHFGVFLKSLKLVGGGMESGPAAPVTREQPQTGGDGFVTKATIGGWQGEIFRDYVRFDRNGVTVMIFWNISLDHVGAGHLGQNLWRMTVARSFRVLREEPQEDDGLAYFKSYGVRGVVEDRSGKRLAAYLTPGLRNGVATRFVVLAADDATIQRTFPKYEAIWDMVAYNHFPVSAGELAGRWTTSVSSASEMYYTSTGNYAGLSVAAASVDYDFNANGTYVMVGQATLGTLGNLSNTSERRTGTWQVSGNTLVLRDSKGKVDEYQCGMVAIGGGKALRIQHKVYTGSKWDLLRAK